MEGSPHTFTLKPAELAFTHFLLSYDTSEACVEVFEVQH